MSVIFFLRSIFNLHKIRWCLIFIIIAKYVSNSKINLICFRCKCSPVSISSIYSALSEPFLFLSSYPIYNLYGYSTTPSPFTFFNLFVQPTHPPLLLDWLTPILHLVFAIAHR